MPVKPQPKLKRGVHRQGDNRVLIVNWDSQHPCPSRSEWHYCAECDFIHPWGGHLYVSPAHGLFFAVDEIAGELVRLGLIARVRT